MRIDGDPGGIRLQESPNFAVPSLGDTLKISRIPAPLKPDPRDKPTMSRRLLNHSVTFREREGKRLLTIEMLVGTQGIHVDIGMKVARKCRHYGLDIIASQ